MAEMGPLLQYGALGLLSIVIFFNMQMFSKAFDRSSKTIDRIDLSIKELTSALQLATQSAERRHAEATRALDRFEAAIMTQTDLLKTAMAMHERFHAITMARIEETAKDTRHSIRNDLTLISLNIQRTKKEGDS